MTSFANALRWSFDLFMLYIAPVSFTAVFFCIILLLYRQLPSIIAENGGYDSAQLVSELKAKHILGESTMVFFDLVFFQDFHLSHPGSEHVRGKGGVHAGAGNYRELQREEAGVGAGQRGGRDDTQVWEIPIPIFILTLKIITTTWLTFDMLQG